MTKTIKRPRAYAVIGNVQYSWIGWLGCQLESREIRTVPAGTTRTLNFGDGEDVIDVTVHTTKREGLFVRTTWSVSKYGTPDEYQARIRRLQNALRELF